jgi:hypothetical protein
MTKKLHQSFILRPNCVPEKVGVNKKSLHQKLYSYQKEKILKINGNNQPKALNRKIKGRKLKGVVNLEGL